MADESFDDEDIRKPLPLVVPDDGPNEFDPSMPLPMVTRGIKCKGFERDGKPCWRYVTVEKEYCFIHDPTIDVMMQMLVRRLDSFVQKCEDCGSASAEEILTIATAAKAFALLWDRKPEKAAKVLGWRMKGAI